MEPTDSATATTNQSSLYTLISTATTVLLVSFFKGTAGHTPGYVYVQRIAIINMYGLITCIANKAKRK